MLVIEAACQVDGSLIIVDFNQVLVMKNTLHGLSEWLEVSAIFFDSGQVACMAFQMRSP